MNPLDFPGGERLAPAALRAARRTHALRERLAARARGRKLPVIYANDNFGRWESQFSNVLECCRALPGAPARIAALLAPRAGDYSVLKPRHSAFFGTPLDFLLGDLKVDTLILTGIAADSCITFTALEAYMHKYRLWIPADCVAAETPALKTRALAHLARVAKAATAASSTPAARVLAGLARIDL